MKKKFSVLITGLLLAASVSTLPAPVYASNSTNIVPSTAYIGMFRTIFIYVSASDSAIGIWETGVWADASTVPAGIWIDFDPAFVRFSSSIESRMLVYAGPAASPGTYSITIKAGWTTIIGQHWETQTTFTLQVETVSERYWAQNPTLLLQNPPNPTSADKWHPAVCQWVPPNGPSWEVDNTENLYANWNVSGRVDMMATAVDSTNIDQVAHFIQGLPEGTYQPPPVTLNPQKTQMNLKGAVTGIFTTFPDNPLSWTGIKWDLWATSIKDGRTLYIELYFVRTGGNLLWELTPPLGFSVHPGHNEMLKLGDTWDNALLAITEPSMSFNQAFVSIVTLGPTTCFSIDVTGIFGFVAYEYATFFPEVWDSSRSINDYNLTQVALCLEANNNGASVTPQCSISLEDFELKGSYLADINLDGKIDNTDVSTVNNALNSALGDSSYLPNADLNLDRIIDSTDLAMVTNSVGKTFPAPWLTVSSSAGGTTSPAPGTYLYDYGSSVTVSASAYSGYTFNYWLLDGATVYGNPITVTMDADHNLEAYFKWVNSLPNTPSKPSGPTSGYRNVWYTYSTTATDPDGDNIRYEFEFSGPIPTVSFTTGWYASGQTGSINVMWETTDPLGTYQIRVRAQDVYEEWSNWSPYLTVNIVNRPVTVETRYFRGDQQTINGLLAYILGTSQSSSLQVASGMASGKLAVLWSSDVVVRHADGSETTIGTKIAQMSRGVNGEGIQSASWTCLLTNVVPTDAVVIKVYDKYGAAGAWNLRATFITEQLGASQLDNVAWTFHYYTYRLYDGSDTYGDFMWGTSTYNSRIENFTWTPVMA